MKILVTIVKQPLSFLIGFLLLGVASQLGAQESPNLTPTSSTDTARAMFSMY
jgi:hypothetical protein